MTARPVLYVGRHACGIPGRGPAESEQLLDELTAFTGRPPRVFSHVWQVGDVAV